MKKTAPSPLCDSHCHLTAPELPGGPTATLERAIRAGVSRIVVVESIPDSWPDTLAFCRGRAELLPAFGVHPCFLPSEEELRSNIAALDALAPQLSAIGETGLDGNSPDPDLQETAFRLHLAVAMKHRKPVLLHCRKGLDRLLRIWNELSPDIPALLHCYSGSAAQVAQFAARGFYFSFGGPITFTNARRPIEALAAVPPDRLLIETDSPDLSPEPLRGEVNEPANLPIIADSAARIRNSSVQNICETTYANSSSFFGF
jgi:TatD DNase family protein